MARVPTLFCSSIPRTGNGSFKGEGHSSATAESSTFSSTAWLVCQVPLSGDKWDKIISEQDALTPKMLLSQLQEQNIHVCSILLLHTSGRLSV